MRKLTAETPNNIKRFILSSYQVGDCLKHCKPNISLLQILPPHLHIVFAGFARQGKSSTINSLKTCVDASFNYFEEARVGSHGGVAETATRLHYELHLGNSLVVISDTRGMTKSSHFELELPLLLSGGTPPPREDDIRDEFQAINSAEIDQNYGRAHLIVFVLREDSLQDQDKLKHYRRMAALIKNRIPYMFLITSLGCQNNFDVAPWKDQLECSNRILQVQLYEAGGMADENKNALFLSFLLQAIALADIQGLMLKDPGLSDRLRYKTQAVITPAKAVVSKHFYAIVFALFCLLLTNLI